jgi:hypothetical protein
MRIDSQEMLKVLQEMTQLSEKILELTHAHLLMLSQHLSLCQ